MISMKIFENFHSFHSVVLFLLTYHFLLALVSSSWYGSRKVEKNKTITNMISYNILA